MPAAARLGDKAQVAQDAHGCPACPHPGVGPIVSGSPDVNINAKPAARLDDLGIHAVCCGPNTFTVAKGSATVYVNGKPLARLGDKTKHCGGTGPIIEGSPDVLIDDGAASAQSLGSYLSRARQILSQKAQKTTKGKKKKHKDTNRGTGPQNLAHTVHPGQKPPAQKHKPAPQAMKLVAQLVDETNVPRAGLAYRVTMPDGTVETGESDGQGFIRIDAQGKRGSCTVVIVGQES